MVETQSAQSNLWTAAGEGDLDRVKHLIEVEGQSAGAKDQNGYTAIHAAVSWAHPTLLRYLLSKGGDINARDNDGDTPLFTCESLEMCKLVLELGGNASLRNSEGQTAAQSLQEDQPEIAQFLATLTGETLPAIAEPSTSSETADRLQAEYTNVQPPEDVDSLDPASRAAAIETNNRAGTLLAQVQAILQECDASGEDPEPRIRLIVDNAVRSTMRAGQEIGQMQAEREEQQQGQATEAPPEAGDKRQRTE